MNEDIEEGIKKKKVRGIPWVKGVSGNPKGRPKGSFSIKTKVKQWLENNPDDYRKFVKYFVKVNRELAWRMLEGNPPQPLEHTGEVNLPFNIIIKKDDRKHELDEPEDSKTLPPAV